MLMQMENKAVTQKLPDEWHPSKGYRLHILIVKEEDGSISAIVLNLPGAGSCGATEEEAIENTKEAVQGVIEEYEASGQDIPWKDSTTVEIPSGAKHRWIILNA